LGLRMLVASSAVLVDAIPVVIVARLNASSRPVACDTASAGLIGAHCAVALGYSEFSIFDFYAGRVGLRQRCARREHQYVKSGKQFHASIS
jgi:hypothetical protein